MSRPIKVAYVSLFSDFVGGGEYSLFNLMTNLPEGVTPVFLIPEEGELSAKATQHGIEWHIVPMPKIGMDSMVAAWAWWRMLKRIGPDILHANGSRPAFYAGILGKLLGIPVLFHCRVGEQDVRLDRWLVRLVDGVIANSQNTAARFSAWPWLKVSVIYNGLDVSVSKPVCENSKPFGAKQVLLMVARVSRCKRHDIALDIFDRLSKEMRGLHLVCAGDKEITDVAWWNELQQRTQSMPGFDRIHWLGMVDQAALEVWYAAADVLVLPSDYESFGRVLVEAMAMRVPVVAFGVGGVPEVVEDGRQGVLAPAGDVSAMSDAVMALLKDDALRKRMGEAGVERASVFSIGAHVERVTTLYREMLHAF